MTLTCSYCGESFTVYDNRRREYCPKCQKNGKRYATQFKERLQREPLLSIYVSHYKKLHNLYKKNIITKNVLDDWRHLAIVKKHEVSVEDFKYWCEKTFCQLKNNKECFK